MKRILALLLAAALLLALAGCSGKKTSEAPVDLKNVYQQMQEKLPRMMELDETMQLNLLGIRSEDCAQAVVAIFADGLQADEVWLLEAKDAAALERLTEKANSRVAAKLDETEFYLPEQYAVVKQAQLITRGNYLALLISPDVEALQTIFETGVK